MKIKIDRQILSEIREKAKQLYIDLTTPPQIDSQLFVTYCATRATLEILEKYGLDTTGISDNLDRNSTGGDPDADYIN